MLVVTIHRRTRSFFLRQPAMSHRRACVWIAWRELEGMLVNQLEPDSLF